MRKSYKESEQGKATIAARAATAEFKTSHLTAQAKYQASAKGKAAMKKWRDSPKGEAAALREKAKKKKMG